MGIGILRRGPLKGQSGQGSDNRKFEAEGFKISGFPTYHDKSKSKERGPNIIFKIEVEGITLLHLGDLGHKLDTNNLQPWVK